MGVQSHQQRRIQVPKHVRNHSINFESQKNQTNNSETFIDTYSTRDQFYQEYPSLSQYPKTNEQSTYFNNSSIFGMTSTTFRQQVSISDSKQIRNSQGGQQFSNENPLQTKQSFNKITHQMIIPIPALDSYINSQNPKNDHKQIKSLKKIVIYESLRDKSRASNQKGDQLNKEESQQDSIKNIKDITNRFKEIYQIYKVSAREEQNQEDSKNVKYNTQAQNSLNESLINTVGNQFNKKNISEPSKKKILNNTAQHTQPQSRRQSLPQLNLQNSSTDHSQQNIIQLYKILQNKEYLRDFINLKQQRMNYKVKPLDNSSNSRDLNHSIISENMSQDQSIYDLKDISLFSHKKYSIQQQSNIKINKHDNLLSNNGNILHSKESSQELKKQNAYIQYFENLQKHQQMLSQNRDSPFQNESLRRRLSIQKSQINYNDCCDYDPNYESQSQLPSAVLSSRRIVGKSAIYSEINFKPQENSNTSQSLQLLKLHDISTKQNLEPLKNIKLNEQSELQLKQIQSNRMLLPNDSLNESIDSQTKRFKLVISSREYLRDNNYNHVIKQGYHKSDKSQIQQNNQLKYMKNRSIELKQINIKPQSEQIGESGKSSDQSQVNSKLLQDNQQTCQGGIKDNYKQEVRNIIANNCKQNDKTSMSILKYFKDKY